MVCESRVGFLSYQLQITPVIVPLPLSVDTFMALILIRKLVAVQSDEFRVSVFTVAGIIIQPTENREASVSLSAS